MDADDHDPSRPPVLVLTRDAGLREHLLRLAAAAGSAVAAPVEPAAALRGWAGAGLVLVGTDAAPELVTLSPARRAAVHLVTWPPVPDDAYRDALALGAEDVLDLPRCDAWVGDLVADAAEPPGGADPPTGHGAAGAPGRAGVGAADGPGVVVGVVGGSGGAGVTTLVAALGQVGSGRGRTLLVDLDPHGPGLDRVVGLDDRPGVGWDDLDRSAGRLGARALREAVPRQGDLGVLTWRDGARTDVPPPGAVGAVLDAARRGHRLVVVDLARQVATGGDVLARLDRLLVVARPGLAPAASAVRLVDALSGRAAPLLVVRGDPVAAGRLERATGVPLLLSMSDQRGLAESVDLGLGPVRHRRGALGRAAAEVLALLAVRGPSGLVA